MNKNKRNNKKNRILAALIAGALMTSGVPGTLSAGITSYALSPIIKAPTDLKALTLSSTSINVTWTAAKGADAYRVYYKLADKSEYTFYADTTMCVCSFTELKPHTKYTFMVKPLLGSEGDYTEQPAYVTCTGQTKQTSRFSPLDSISAIRITDSTVELYWGHVYSTEFYRVYMLNEQTKKWEKYTDVVDHTVVIKGLMPNTKYSFCVSSVYVDQENVNKLTASRKSPKLTVSTVDPPKDSYLVLADFGSSQKETSKFEGNRPLSVSKQFEDGSIRSDTYDDLKIILHPKEQIRGVSDINLEYKSLFFTEDDKFFMASKFLGLNKSVSDNTDPDDVLNRTYTNLFARRGKQTKKFDTGDRIVYIWKKKGMRTEFLVKFKNLSSYAMTYYGVYDSSLVPKEFEHGNDRETLNALTSACVVDIMDKTSGGVFRDRLGDKMIEWETIYRES